MSLHFGTSQDTFTAIQPQCQHRPQPHPHKYPPLLSHTQSDYRHAYPSYAILTSTGSEDTLTAIQAKGAGYAISQAPELATVLAVGQASGILLDPVYSGKALHCLLGRMREEPEAWRGKRVLFVHTGGLLVKRGCACVLSGGGGTGTMVVQI